MHVYFSEQQLPSAGANVCRACRMLDGIDAVSTAPFTMLTELRAKVAAHPKIQPIYAEAEGTRLAFQPSK